MEDDAKADAAVDVTKADADAGKKLDMLLSHMDAITKRMDAQDAKADSDRARMDSFEDRFKKDASKKDEEADCEPKDVAADKSKKDSRRADASEVEEKDKEDKREEAKMDKRKDAEGEDDKKRADSQSPRRPYQPSDADLDALASAQIKADSVFSSLGKRAPRHQEGMTPLVYRRHLANELKRYSNSWKEADLAAVKDEKTFSVIEGNIYADAMIAAATPMDLGDGELREVHRQDPKTGSRETMFYGRKSFVHAMSPSPMYVKRIEYTGVGNGPAR